MFYNFFVCGLVKGIVCGLVKGRVSVTLFGMGNFKVYIQGGQTPGWCFWKLEEIPKGTANPEQQAARSATRGAMTALEATRLPTDRRDLAYLLVLSELPGIFL